MLFEKWQWRSAILTQRSIGHCRTLQWLIVCISFCLFILYHIEFAHSAVVKECAILLIFHCSHLQPLTKHTSAQHFVQCWWINLTMTLSECKQRSCSLFLCVNHRKEVGKNGRGSVFVCVCACVLNVKLCVWDKRDIEITHSTQYTVTSASPWWPSEDH